MSLPLTFFPDGPRARQLDARMREHLADSLEYLAQAMDEQLGIRHEGVAERLVDLRQGRPYPPTTFGLYYDLAQALMAGDNALAQELLADMALERPLTDGVVEVTTLDRIQPPVHRERYQRLMDTDPDTPFIIVPPPLEGAQADIARFCAALDRLARVLPELSAEFTALVRQVILVNGAKDLGYDFAGGSCYMLWGALFINADRHQNEVEIMEAIAHEAGHSFLFGCTVDEPLVLNEDDEKYASPLRDDPRPMDGIYHATYVSARMHWAMDRLLAGGQLDEAERALARSHRDADRVNFWSGLKTVRASAQLSDTGRTLMAEAEKYMAAFPA